MQLWEKEIVFLGHVLSDEGIKVDSNKIVAVTKWLSPKTITSLWGFISLTGYYIRFVWNYTHIMVPLTSLLKKDAFKWNDEAEACFRRLKLLMTYASVLSATYLSKTIFLECDASWVGLGVVIMQDNHLITFKSWKFKPRENKKSTSDK